MCVYVRLYGHAVYSFKLVLWDAANVWNGYKPITLWNVGSY
jgi:hypothetical protein